MDHPENLNQFFEQVSAEEILIRLSRLGVRVPPSNPTAKHSSNQNILDFCRQLEEASFASEFSDWMSPIVLSGLYEIFDFTKGYDAHRELRFPYGWGRYNEDRVGMYSADIFQDRIQPRTVHMGVDLGAPAGTPVFSPLAARLHSAEFRSAVGDYGGTLILKAEAKGSFARPLFFLFGHLSRASLKLVESKGQIEAGELIGWLGEKRENGGWNPHLHLQLSWLEPLSVDLPGAVSVTDRSLATLIFPDPSPYLQEAASGWPKSAAAFS